MVNFHENFVVVTLKVYKFVSKIIFLDLQCSHGDFSKFQKTVFKDCPHITWLLFSCFHPFGLRQARLLDWFQTQNFHIGFRLKTVQDKQDFQIGSRLRTLKLVQNKQDFWVGSGLKTFKLVQDMQNFQTDRFKTHDFQIGLRHVGF